jgi:N-ethylmaleimide reductase
VNDTFDDDPAERYTYLARRLNSLGLAYLHVTYDSGYSRGTAPALNPIDLLRLVFAGTLLAVGGFTRASEEAALAAGRADLIVYARPFLANPDLVERFRVEAPLNQGDVRTYYGGGTIVVTRTTPRLPNRVGVHNRRLRELTNVMGTE